MDNDEEMSLRILATLYEIGENNVFSIINGIIESTGKLEEVLGFKRALTLLLENGDVTVGYELSYPLASQRLDNEGALELLSRFEKLFKFQADARPHWTLADGDISRDPLPSVKSTPAGREKAFEIQMRRGYEWWRPARR